MCAKSSSPAAYPEQDALVPHPHAWHRRDGILYCEDVEVERLAEKFGTPLYVYSLAQLLGAYDRIAAAFAAAHPMIAYSVKANGNLAILSALAARGAAFDIVSMGELERVARIGADPAKVIFAGVGKRRDEIRRALQFGVAEFNVESPGEAEVIDEEARDLGVVAPVALRVNPDVDPHTHEYITTGRKENKFGVNLDLARGVVERILSLRGLRFVGLHAHIGSQILDENVHAISVERLEEFVRWLSAGGVRLESLNMGGGFGIDYERGRAPLAIEKVAEKIIPIARRLGARLVLEPGRYIVASAGALITRTLYVKKGSVKTFVIVDASMTDLIRPSLYAACHRIAPARLSEVPPGQWETADVVGPVCETGDFLARDRKLPPVQPGDILAVMDAGAYSFAMSSNYNTRPRPAEVIVKGRRALLARRRETLDDLLSFDCVPPELRLKPRKTPRGGRGKTSR